MSNKILDSSKLSQIIKSKKDKGLKIVLCHGVFDLIHIGHIMHFNEAKSYGDILIVSLTDDKFIDKGPNRPAFTSNIRMKFLESIECIDYVTISKSSSATEIIKKIKPHIYCKGKDYKKNTEDITGKIYLEKKAIDSVKGKIVYTSTQKFSSTYYINKYLNFISKDQEFFINKIKSKNDFFGIVKKIDNFKKLKILLIGEIIIDDYVFCETVGKSGKEPFLVLKELHSNKYLGGTGAIANHLSDFCKSITIISSIGKKRESEKFIKNNISDNINLKLIPKSNSSTIIKKRYVDYISKSKTLGVYSINDNPLNEKEEKTFEGYIEQECKKNDLVIISDYGHGLISKKIASKLNKLKKFKSLNTQINSFNSGYITLDKYKNLDCLIINEGELRQNFRDKDTKIEILLKKISQSHCIKNVTVTRGAQGVVMYSSNTKKTYYCPAFATNIVDKIGSGDAFLSLLSLSEGSNNNHFISLLLGSLAAAQSVETIGNSYSVNKLKILNSIKHILI